MNRILPLWIVLSLGMSSAEAGHRHDVPIKTPDVSRLAAFPKWQGSLDKSPVLDLRDSHWEKVAARHRLDPYVLYAVALVESARISRGLATPWPWALNQAGKPLYPETSHGALAHVRARLAQGDRCIDVGLMQVNLRWHGQRVKSLEDLIDPATNVELGAQIMAEAISTSPGDLALGIGRYHAWQNRPEAYRYGRRVLDLADRLRSSSYSVK